MPRILREHFIFILLLATALGVYLVFPLELQAMEPYAYAAAIEKYYNLATTFAIAQGDYLPNFGRYHPNHPLGHALAGLAFDWLNIPALAWMKSINIFSALASALFLYLISLQLQLSKRAAVVGVATFLASNYTLMTVLSGEWHIPALALSLAGLYNTILYLEHEKPRSMYAGALLFAFAICYHMAALSFFVPAALMVLFSRPLKGRWSSIVLAGAIVSLSVILVYAVLPFLLFHFDSVSDFLRTFLIYKFLNHIRYSGFEWLLVAVQTLSHSLAVIPSSSSVLYWLSFPIFLGIIAIIWRFYRSSHPKKIKILFVMTVLWWPAVQGVFDARANGMNGWPFVLPILCFLIAETLNRLESRAFFLAALLPVIILSWNFWHLILPNRTHKRDEIFLFRAPEDLPKTTPVAFVIGELVSSIPEIWYAGSQLGFRNQIHFFPCCGEGNYIFRLSRYLDNHPDAIIVTDGNQDATVEAVLGLHNRRYVRWLDRRVVWPAELMPATIYLPRPSGHKYHLRRTIWVPDNRAISP